MVRELGQYLAVDLFTFLCGLMDESSMMTPKVVINVIAWQVPQRCPFHCASALKHGSGLYIPGDFLRARFPANPKNRLSIQVSLSLFSSPAASPNLTDPDPRALLLPSAFYQPLPARVFQIYTGDLVCFHLGGMVESMHFPSRALIGFWTFSSCQL